MNEVVRSLQENPVRYLAAAGRDGRTGVAPSCLRGSWTASCGSAPTTGRMSTGMCRSIPMARRPFPARPSACLARPFLRTTWPPRRCASRTPSSRGQHGDKTTYVLRGRAVFLTGRDSLRTETAAETEPFRCRRGMLKEFGISIAAMLLYKRITPILKGAQQ